MKSVTRTIIAMTAAIAAAALGATTASAQATQRGPGLSGIVYTADENGNSISRIDLESGKVVTKPVSISPHNVQITADGSRLLAVGEAAGHGHEQSVVGHGAKETRGKLLVFKANKSGDKPAASILVGRHPAHVVANSTGRRAFVTNAEDDSVAVIDLRQNKVLKNVPTGKYPHGLRISPDGRELFVANVEDGTVSVIDTEKFIETVRIPVGRSPVQVGFTPDGKRVYVSLRDENSVAVIDTVKRTKIGTVPVGRGPIQVHATSDGRYVFVANQGSEAEPDDTVSVIDVEANVVIDTVRTGKGAHGVAVSATHAFITNIAAGSVSVIDVSTRKVISEFRVGLGPNGITFTPGGIGGKTAAR